MRLPRRLGTVALLLLVSGTALAQQTAAPKDADKLPLTGLPPSRILPNLCVLQYRVSTTSPECQAFFDQGLGFFYSYVWMEAARSFETAVKHDPECALAWWGLSRALERWGKNNHNDALTRAKDLMERASHRERLLIEARLKEKGMWPNVGGTEERKKAAIQTLDTLLSLYDDDEEGWYYRAQLGGGSGLFGGQVSAVPFYKSLLRINPLHPGANHELVHYYENARRPALGWVHAEKYIESSPGIPHPFHMQAHLATRLGRWDKTSDRSARAIELERAYHKAMNVKPKEDHQFSHHLEILTLSLIHDGRFREARALKEEVQGYGYKHWLPWFRLHLAERDWDAALSVAENYRKTDKAMASYLRALVYLRQGDTARAAPEVEVLRLAYQQKKNDRQLENRTWEAQGLLLCRMGDADAGLRLLAKAVERTKDDYGHHAWGNGAYYMEAWGIAALQAGRHEVAEEAFLEALAHDPGSMRAALGLHVLCERLGRREEAERYAQLARRCWRRAEVQSFDAELVALREECIPSRIQKAERTTTTTATGEVGP